MKSPQIHRRASVRALGAAALLFASTLSAQEISSEDVMELFESKGATFASDDTESEYWTEAMGLQPLYGTVTVGNNLAQIDLPSDWSFLQGEEARFFVEEVWGNPPDDTTLGFAFPPGDPTELPYWGVIISYEDDGHVDDEDAASIDYTDLMQSMRSDAEESNQARQAQGYGTLSIFGWAESPHYDATEKKLYWAKDLLFSGDQEHTLNYDVRVLGRTGVLSMNAVADLADLDEVRLASRELLDGTHFLPGNRYEDFDPSVDRMAAYGIGGLIAGNILLKGGLMAKLGLIMAKSAKLLVLAAFGIGALAKRMFGGSSAS